MRRWRSFNAGFGYELLRIYVPAVETPVGIVVGAKRRAFQRNTGKYAARTRVAEHFGAERHIGGSLRVPPLRPGSNRGISTQLHFVVKHALCSAGIHYQ